MLIQLLIARPQMIGPVLSATPSWVWFLLAGLLGLGLALLRDSNQRALRVAVMPAAMTVLSLWGTVSAFSPSARFGYVLLAWAIAALALGAAIGRTAPPAGARFDPATRRFSVPGSWVPLVLILGIFLVKYVVGVEVAMQPGLAQDGSYSLTYGVIYGAFSGIFAGRSIRLGRLALCPSRVSAPTVHA